MSAFSRFFKRIDWPNHFMAFVSTLLGVWLAFYLGNYNEYKREHARMEVAIKSVRQELTKNLAKTKEHMVHVDSLLGAIKAFSKLIDDNMNMVATENQMADFIEHHGWFMRLGEKRPLRDSFFEYDGRLNLNLHYANLSEIAWENTKLMDVLHLIDTETAFQLHGIYRLQEETQRSIDEALDIVKNLFQNNHDSNIITGKVINQLKGQLQFAGSMEKGLELNYEEILKRLPE